MTPSNSFYLELLGQLLEPQFVLSDPSLVLSSSLDFEYCSKRFRKEGMTYLSVELHKLRTAIDQSLETGQFECPTTFGKWKSSALPAFLVSHFRKVFFDDGRLRENADITSLRHIRQITSAFYKLEFPFTSSLEKKALENFVNNEIRIRQFLNNEDLWKDAKSCELVSSAAMLVRKVFEGFDPGEIIPRHGPGKVATREEGLDKWRPPTIKYSRLHEEFPYYRYLYHSTSCLGDWIHEYRLMTRANNGFAVEPVSKIALVPKDSRGPRVIALEPLLVQFIQQGMRVSITKWVETHAPTAGFVNFTDQTINQQLALQSSVSREWATIDMKDASDLVSVDLVKMVFRLKPRLLSKLLACRTQFTRFPDGSEFRLKKFAGMGAATCFPVEALVFWAIAVSAISIATGQDLFDCTSLVYVFGDDIICPWWAYTEVTDALESCGLIVSKTKSFWKGFFRESCGVDAYKGVNITPIRFSKLIPASSADGVSYVAWVAYANKLEAYGYTKAAATIWRYVESFFGPTPYGVSRSPFPCRIVDDPSRAEELNSQFLKRRLRKRYQRIEFYVKYVKSTEHSALDFDSWARLNRNLISGPGDEPSEYTLPDDTGVCTGWMAV